MSKPVKPLSKIEQLPAEIIQQIFSWSVDVAFPRASPILGQKLSAESVYRDLFVRLFCSFQKPALPPGISLGRERVKRWNLFCQQDSSGAVVFPLHAINDQVLNDKFEEDELDDNERYVVLQREQALQCRWMTVDRFEQYRQMMLQQVENVPRTDNLSSRVVKAVREADLRADRDADLWFGRGFHFPTSLLRYRSQISAKRSCRQFSFLCFFLRYWPVKLDPFGDGDERARSMFCSAIQARDVRFMHLMIYNGLIDMAWENDIHEAILARGDNFSVLAFLRATLHITTDSHTTFITERNLGKAIANWQDVGWYDQDVEVENPERWLEQWFGSDSGETDKAWTVHQQRLRSLFSRGSTSDWWNQHVNASGQAVW